jgi:hypothetical protein
LALGIIPASASLADRRSIIDPLMCRSLASKAALSSISILDFVFCADRFVRLAEKRNENRRKWLRFIELKV